MTRKSFLLSYFEKLNQTYLIGSAFLIGTLVKVRWEMLRKRQMWTGLYKFGNWGTFQLEWELVWSRRKQRNRTRERERERHAQLLAASMNSTGTVNFLPKLSIHINRSPNPLLSLPLSRADMTDVGLNYFELLNHLHFPHKKEPLLAATTLTAIYISFR